MRAATLIASLWLLALPVRADVGDEADPAPASPEPSASSAPVAEGRGPIPAPEDAVPQTPTSDPESTQTLASEGEDAASRADAPATVQNRFATKLNTLGLHAYATSHFRGDFYDQVGFGGSASFYPWEEFGLELRATGHLSWLNSTAQELIRETGRIPDTRRRNATFLVGGRLSIGYGKLQVGDAFIVHFDPQVVAQLGVTVADEDRFLPTALAGLGVLVHFDFGLQLRVDLMAIVDLEDRNDRGVIASVGFAPLIGLGWRADLGGM